MRLSPIIFLVSLACASRHNEIPYPTPTPDTVALKFLEGIVTTDVLDFNSAFSPDGKSFYFARTVNSQWDIYVTTHDGVNWGKPVVAGFCDSKHSEADPVFAPDGKLYFISNYHDDTTRKDHDIWAVQSSGNGQWSTPENVIVVNSDSSEYYVSFAGNGNMYFGSARSGGFGSHDIYKSVNVNGAFQIPQNLGAAINSIEAEHDPCISKDESFLIFKSENRADGFGSADFYCTIPNGAGWKQAINLGPSVNTDTYEYCAYLSPDGKYFFFSSEEDVKWISATFIKNRIFDLHQK